MNTSQNNNIVMPACTPAMPACGASTTDTGSPASTVWKALEWLQLDAYEAKKKSRSAWARGVAEYMEELLYNLAERLRKVNPTTPAAVDVKAVLLNGAENWIDYSFGGCTLIHNEDIAARLAPPSQRKRLENNGVYALKCQARALEQASSRIVRLWKKYTRN